MSDTYRLGEVEFAERQRVVDAESSHSLDESGRTTAVVGQGRDFSHVSAVTDFHEVERNDVSDREVLEEQRRVDSQLSEVAVKHVHRGGVGAGGSVTVEVTGGLEGSRSRGLTVREHEVRERTLHQRSSEAVVGLILTGLLIDGREDVLEGRLGEVSEVARHDGGRGSVRGAVRKAELIGHDGSRFVGVLVSGLDEPLVESTGLVGNDASTDGLFGLGGVGGAHRLFHVTLEHGHGLGNVVLEFILHSGDVGHAGLGEFRDSRGASENLDEVAEFITILLRRGLDEVFVIGGGHVGAVHGAVSLGLREGINLPAEESLLGLRTLAGHGREGGVLRIDEGDEVGDFFPAAEFIGLGEVAFEQLSHSRIVLGVRGI